MKQFSLISAVLLAQLLGWTFAYEQLSFDSTSAFKYFYPLVLINLTRTSQLQEYVAAGAVDGGVNLLSPSRKRPDSKFTQIVKPNVDTLYITAWLDLKAEPLILGVPEITDRFYMVQLMDAWSNSFASPGTRTTGSKAGHFALCGPDFIGSAPTGTVRINSTTNVVWLLARIQIFAAESDIDKVHHIQDGFSLTLFNDWIEKGEVAKRPTVPEHSVADSTEKPPEIVRAWTAQEYFTYATEVMRGSNPPAADADMLKTLEHLGISSKDSLDWGKLSYYQKGQLKFGKSAGKASILLAEAKIRVITNGWQGLPNSIGDYGTDYDARAAVADIGLGANKPEDACYRVHNLRGRKGYKITFRAGESPPVHAFWSLTAYTKEGYLIPNGISRYSLGSESRLQTSADGSLTIYLQGVAPSDATEKANWLPTPADESDFVVTARFYYPGEAVLNSTWVLPSVDTDEVALIV